MQAIARDLLAHALVGLEKDGMRPVMHVHDEIVCDHPDADKALAAINAYLTTKAPTWAKGLPLDSKGFTSPFYRK